MGLGSSKLSGLSDVSYAKAYRVRDTVYGKIVATAASKSDQDAGVVGGCDVCGGSDGTDVKLRDLAEYKKSIPASLKEKVIRQVAAEIAKIMKNSDINPEEKDLHVLSMQVFKALPNLADGVMLVEDNEVHKRSCIEAGKIINKLLGYTMVDVKAPVQEICRQVAEIMLSFATGVHLEFARIYKEVENVLENLKTMHDALDAATIELKNAGKVVTDVEAKSDIALYLEVFEKALSEAKRQRQILENLISGSIRADAEGIELVMSDVEHISTLVKKLKQQERSSSKEMNEVSSALLQLFGENLVLLAKVDKALKFLGMSVEDFKTIPSATDLKKKLEEIKQSKLASASPEDLAKVLKYTTILEQGFARRDRLLYGLGLTGGDDMDGAADTTVTEPESRLGRQIRKDAEAKRIIMQAFNKELFAIFDRILDSMGFYDKVGKTVPVTDELERFSNDVQRLKDFRQTKLYYALVGFDKSASGRQYKETYVSSIKYLLDSVKALSAMESYRPVQQNLSDLKTGLEALLRLVELYSDKIKQTIGGDSEGGNAVDDIIKKDIPGVSRAVLQIDETLTYFQYFIRVSRIRENLKYTKEGLDAINGDYNNLVSEAIANKIKELADERDTKVKEILDLPQFKEVTAGGDVGAAEVEDRKKDREGVKDFVNDIYKTKREFYETVEAVEMYLKEFTRLIVANPNNLMELKKMLDSVEVISKWFDDRSGEKLCSVFEYFPAGSWRVTSAAPATRLMTNTHDDAPSALRDVDDVNRHYYHKLQTQIASSIISPDGGDFTIDPVHISLVDPTAGNALVVVMNTATLLTQFATHADRNLKTALEESLDGTAGGLARTLVSAFMGAAAGAHAGVAGGLPTKVRDYIVDALNKPLVKAFLIKRLANSSESEAIQPIALGFHLNPLRPTKENREELEKRIREVINKQSFLKNIIETFVIVGSMIGKDDINKMQGIIPPVQLYQRMTNYLTKSNIDLGLFDHKQVNHFKATYNPNTSAVATVGSDTNNQWVYNSGGANRHFNITTFPEATANANETLHSVDADLTANANADALSNATAGGHAMGSAERLAAHNRINARGRKAHGGLILSTIIAKRHPQNANSVVHDHSYFDKMFHEEDDIFVMLLKSIVTKVFTVVGLYDLLEKPYGHTSLSPLRMLVGGEDESAVKIHEGAVELYFRLPLLAEFYRELFSKQAFAKVKLSTNESLGMIPELPGPFGRLVEIIFQQADYVNSSTYSKSDTRDLIVCINELYEKYSTKAPGNEVSQMMHDFVNEINKHYGIILDEEMKDYDKLNIMKYQSHRITPAEESFDYAILPNENEDEVYVPPSTKLLDGQLATREPKYTLEKAKINRIHIELINKFRDHLNSVFAEEVSSIKTSTSTTESYRHLFRSTNSKLAKAKDDKEKYEVIANLIRGEDYMSLGEQLRLVVFHETVVTGLTALNSTYNILKTFKDNVMMCNISEINKLIEDALFNAAANGGLAHTNEINRNTLTAIPSLDPRYRAMLNKYLVSATGTPNNSEIPDFGLNTDVNPTLYTRNANGNIEIRFAALGAASLRGINGIFLLNRDGSLPAQTTSVGAAGDSTHTVELSKDDPRIKYYIRYAVSRNDLVRDLLENVMGLSLQTNNLVEVKVGDSIQMNYTGLVEKIMELSENVRYMIEYFRRVLPDHTLINKYEDESYMGSFYWLQRHLIDNLIRGINVDIREDTDLATLKSYKDVSLDGLNEIIANTYKTCISETPFSYRIVSDVIIANAGDITPQVDPLLIIVPGAATDHKPCIVIDNKPSKANLNNAFSQLVYWNPIGRAEKASDHILSAHLSSANADSGFNDSNADALASGFESSDNEVNRFSHLYTHSGELVDNILANPADRFKRANRSLMTVFNQILAKYINLSYDHITNKLYKPVVDDFVNGTFNSSIASKNFYPDAIRDASQVMEACLTKAGTERADIYNVLEDLGFRQIAYNAAAGGVAAIGTFNIAARPAQVTDRQVTVITRRAQELVKYKHLKHALAYHAIVKAAEAAKNVVGSTPQTVRAAAIAAARSVLGDDVVFQRLTGAGPAAADGDNESVDITAGGGAPAANNDLTSFTDAVRSTSLGVYHNLFRTTAAGGASPFHGSPLSFLLYSISSANIAHAVTDNGLPNVAVAADDKIQCYATAQEEYEAIKIFGGMQFVQAIFNNARSFDYENGQDFFADAQAARPQNIHADPAKPRLLAEADRAVAVVDKLLKAIHSESFMTKYTGSRFSTNSIVIDDVYKFNLNTANPTKAGIVYQSIGAFLSEIITSKHSESRNIVEFKYLTDKLSDIPLAVQESYAVNLPIFEKMFHTLNKKAALLKQLLQNQRFETSISSVVPARAGLWVGQSRAAIPRLTLKKQFTANQSTFGWGNIFDKEGYDNRSVLLDVCEDVSRASLSLINCCNSVISELPFKTEFFELYNNFVSQYQNMNNKLPLMPLSQAFRALTDKSALVPTAKTNTNEFSYLTGTRLIFTKYGSALQHEKLRGAKELTNQYNNLFSESLPLDERGSEKMIENIIQLLRYSVDFRAVNNEFSVVDLEDAELSQKIRMIGVKEDDVKAHRASHTGLVDDRALDKSPLRSGAAWQVASTMTDLTSIIELTKSTDQPTQHRKIADIIRPDDQSSASRKRLRVKNIIDMNIVPINFNLLSRQIPLTYIYNYSYTFDRMIMELYDIPQAHYDIVKNHPLTDYPFRKESSYLFASMLMDPYKPLTSYRDVNVYLGKLMRGDNEMELGRAKYISDQIYNKVMFRELYPIDDRQDDDIDPRYIMHNKVGGAPDIVPLSHATAYGATPADQHKQRMLALLNHRPLMKMLLDLYIGHAVYYLPLVTDATSVYNSNIGNGLTFPNVAAPAGPGAFAPYTANFGGTLAHVTALTSAVYSCGQFEAVRKSVVQTLKQIIDAGSWDPATQPALYSANLTSNGIVDAGARRANTIGDNTFYSRLVSMTGGRTGTHALEGLFIIIRELSSSTPQHSLIEYVLTGIQQGRNRYLNEIQDIFSFQLGVNNRIMMFAAGVLDTNAVTIQVRPAAAPAGRAELAATVVLSYPNFTTIITNAHSYAMSVNQGRIPGDHAQDIALPPSADTKPSDSFLTYIGDFDPANPRTVVRALRIDRSDINGLYKRYLRDLGKSRFDTKLVRKLMFLVNIRRTLRLKLSKELLAHEGLIARSSQLIDASTTEYTLNQTPTNHHIMTPYSRDDDQIVL